MTVLNIDTRVGLFRIIRHIEGGLLADTYEVFDEEEKETFALKVLKRDFVEMTGFSDRFHRECQVISQLENDAVVSLDRFDIAKWKHWICYEYFEGFEMDGTTVRTLRDYLKVNPTGLEEEEAVFLVAQILQAVEQAHGIGLLHRNLKPSNIMLRRGEDDRLEVKIADFAMARIVGEETFSELWQAGEEEFREYLASPEEGAEEIAEEQSAELGPAAETWMFRSPEERSGQEGEEASDLYAVAAIAYWSLFGEPFPEDREIRLSADLNSGWLAWLLRCTEENPTDRFADVGEALAQLPRPGTALRYAEMPFEREGHHAEGLASPYRESDERSTDGAEANLREAEQKKKAFKPWATLLIFLSVISLFSYGCWELYRTAFPSPFAIYKCDGFDDYYTLKFGVFEGEVQWRGKFDGEIRSASGQWTKDDEGHFNVRISLLRRRLPENDSNSPAFRAVDAIFKKQTSLDERAKEKRYKRWIDVIDYDSDSNRFLLIKRLQAEGEFFPGRDKEGRIKLFDPRAFEQEGMERVQIYFNPFNPDAKN